MRFSKRAVQVGLALAVIVGPPFIAAGRLSWAGGWLWLVTAAVGLTAVRFHVVRRNPDLPARRSRTGEGTPGWDLLMVNLLRVSIIALIVVAGLDAGRFGWLPMPPAAQYAGVAVMGAGLWIIGLAMGENAHFEATVRIQDDVGHRVIDSGPYSRIRHPGYVGIILAVMASAMVLRSIWALIPAAAAVLVMVVRTSLEDQFLHERLAGYAEYARRVRYRIVPGIW